LNAANVPSPSFALLLFALLGFKSSSLMCFNSPLSVILSLTFTSAFMLAVVSWLWPCFVSCVARAPNLILSLTSAMTSTPLSVVVTPVSFVALEKSLSRSLNHAPIEPLSELMSARSSLASML